MLKLNVGCNFDEQLLDGMIALNKKYDEVKVVELYGSAKKEISGIQNARPDFRLTDTSISDIKNFIHKCHVNNIKFNYVINSPLTSYWFNLKKDDYHHIQKFLDDLQVDFVTVAHPLPLKYLKFNFIISTILEVNNINAIKYYIDNYNVKKICLSIAKNRDEELLGSLADNDISQYIEVLVNEFCSFKGIPCQNFNRKACYELHSLGGNQEKLHNGFPLSWCSASRYKDPSSWLKANIILPWDIKKYNDYFGIDKFKITGRTLPTHFILKVVEAYMSQGEVVPDNLLELWGHVDQIGVDPAKVPPIHISMNKLKHVLFLEEVLERNCETELCENCGYCDEIYKATRL